MKLYKNTLAFVHYKPISLLERENFLTAYDNGRRGVDQPFTIVFILLNRTNMSSTPTRFTCCHGSVHRDGSGSVWWYLLGI